MSCDNNYHQDERCCHDLHCNACNRHPYEHLNGEVWQGIADHTVEQCTFGHIDNE